MVTIGSFTIDIPAATLDDLRDRLRRTRFPEASAAEAWKAGVDPAYLGELVTSWADGLRHPGVPAASRSVSRRCPSKAR